MNALMHPLAIRRCFVRLLVLKFEKELGFVLNRKWERFVINDIFHARDILNNCVTFLEDGGGYAIFAYLKHEDVNDKVYDLKLK
jgi:hypothetical protein